MVSHENVIKNYFNASVRNHYNKGSNVFFENDTLYSYGQHFILCQKVRNGYIVNGDKRSVSTAKHQNITIRNSPDGTPQIPFSAINQIFKTTFDFVKQLQQIEIIDKTEDTYETKYRIDEKTKEKIEYQEHHLGASVIKYKNKYFLSSIDPGSKRYSYFLVELPYLVYSVKDGFRCLADRLTDKEYLDYEQGKIKRQGEYFLIPTEINLKTIELKRIEQEDMLNRSTKIHLMTEDLERKLDLISQEYNSLTDEWEKEHHLHKRIQVITHHNKKYVIEHNYKVQPLPKQFKIRLATVKRVNGKSEKELRIFNVGDRIIKGYDLSEGVGNSHIATETIKDKQGNIYIRGTLRHREHRMICLGKVWHKVIKNSAKRSFTATGRVD